ncbi:MAG TPA: CAP domain-containing protein [Minicystis sp.]|nr:CAP domain-containing protein [Minicystis sp.]
MRRSPFLLALVPLALAAAGCASSTVDSGPSQANPLDAEESAVIAGLKDLRVKSGASDLTLCKSLDVAAAAHADDMRDRSYLSETSPDGSTARSRDCQASYEPACGTTAGVAELVASGEDTGAAALQQWENDAMTSPVLVDPSMRVVGVGRSIGETATVWSLDLATEPDASCAGAM